MIPDHPNESAATLLGLSTDSAWETDSELEGITSNHHIVRALTGDRVTLTCSQSLKRVTWSTSFRFLLDGQEHGFQAWRAGMVEERFSPDFVDLSSELQVGGGTLKVGPARLDGQKLEASDLLESSAHNMPWVGVWTSEDTDHELGLFGANSARAEVDAVHQLSAFFIAGDEYGLSVRPEGSVRRLSVYGPRVSAHIPPLGAIAIYARAEGSSLVPYSEAIRLVNGELYRVEVTLAGTTHHRLVYRTESAVAVIHDPRYSTLDQADRLEALESLDVQWG